MEEETIDTVKAWPEPRLVPNIQVLIGFANFYRRFIQNFSKIAIPLNSILKTNPQPTNALPATIVNNSEIVGSSSRNN